jgi:Domain of unknown function (DUF4382)
MDSKKSTFVPAVLAIAVAVAVISFAMFAGIPLARTTTFVSSTLGSSTTETTTGLVTESQSVQTTQSSQSSQTTAHSTTSESESTGPQQGTLSILLTDPPSVPSGVTKVYITYNSLQVHVAQAGNQSGWTQVQATGQIELLGTVNVSQTISSVKIATGEYNGLRFNISSAQVTYNGQNYTAFVQSAELVIPIIHGIEVNASVPTATIIDISPTVINIGSTSTPEFIIRSVATAYPVPANGVTTGMQQPGARISLIGLGWWRGILQNYTANLQIQNATLNSTSLSINVTDTGSNATTLMMVVVSPLANSFGGPPHGFLPGAFFGDAVFSVLPNGTLREVQFAMPLGAGSQRSVSAMVFRSAGLNLTAGASTTLTYSGPINLGFLSPMQDHGAIIPHEQYLVTVIGTQAVASFVVVAS